MSYNCLVHPAIRDYLESRDPSHVVFGRLATHDDPLVRLTGQLYRAGQRNESLAHFLELHHRAKQTDISQSDPNLLILFFFLWINAARALRDNPLLETLQRKIGTFTSSDTPLELRLLAARAQMVGRGHARYLQGLEGILRKFPRQSPRLPTLTLQWLYDLARYGSLADAGSAYETIETMPLDQEARGILARLRYLNHMLTTVAPSTFSRWDHVAPSQKKETLRTFHATCMALVLDEKPDADSLAFPTPTGRNPLHWVASLQSLRQGQIPEALAWARKHEDSGSDRLNSLHCGLHILIRAELASGHHEVAAALLEQRRQREDTHWLDDLYLAQIAFLSGDRGTARERFSSLLNAVEHHGAQGRLEFELALGPLKRGDLISLSALPKARGIKSPPRETPLGLASPPEESRLLGSSQTMRELRRQLKRAASMDITVLLRGETGTGKELAARSLHEEGPRASLPFVAVNCAAIPENLIASELFGHVRGAFTGADAPRRGAFEEAGGGTLFLDEIGDISPQIQVALLRVLENREVVKVGSSKSQPVTCRVVAATHANLETLMRKALFREDLYYRLNRLEIPLPPLRERHGDIMQLARRFAGVEGAPASFTPRLGRLIERCPWPGNVRQLKNEMEHLRLLAPDKTPYDIGDLPPRLAHLLKAGSPPLKVHNPSPPTPETPPTGDVRERLSRETKDRTDDKGRRLELLTKLFQENTNLRRDEIARAFGLTPRTVSRDLAELLHRGVIRRVCPTLSPRTHYFEKAAR